MYGHLMEPNPFSPAGAVRRAMRCIGQAPQRTGWTYLAHLKGRFLAPAGRRYAPLVVNQTTARSMPCQQTRETGQMGQF